MHMSAGSLTREEIVSKMQELTQITDSNDSREDRIDQLIQLANTIGAGTVYTKIAAVTRYKEGAATTTETHRNPISESELVQNINQALHTHIMIDSCRIANKQYKIAVLAAIIAVISVIITWNVSARVKTKEGALSTENVIVQNASENALSSIKETGETTVKETAENPLVLATDEEVNKNAKKQSGKESVENNGH